MNRKSWRWPSAGLLIFLVAGAGAPTPARPQELPDEARVTATTWLLKDCAAGEQDQLSAILRKYREQLEPFFMNALNAGPEPQLLAALEETVSNRFERRQEALKNGRGLGISDSDLQAARKVTREEYLAGQKEDFVVSYKSHAVAGLGVVGAAKARAALSELSADGTSPLQGSAQQALRQLQTKTGPVVPAR
jgi:hypothetical protein